MKFGDTVIRNLTEADIEDGITEEHKNPKKHGAQEPSDKKRGKKR